MNQLSNQSAVVFIHMPKAAGVTLNTVMARHYSDAQTFTLYGEKPMERVERLRKMPKEERAQLRCLAGHVPYGLHELLSQSATYITMLRDPIDRIISDYHYVLTRPDHWLYQLVTEKNMSLEDYARTGLPAVCNVQTQLLRGGDPDRPLTREDLELAIRRLREDITVVGLHERFDESLVLFRRALGWHNILYVRQNVTRRRPTADQISSSTMECLRSACAMDIELYQAALERFATQCREAGSGLVRGTAALRIGNRLYQAYHQVRRRVSGS